MPNRRRKILPFKVESHKPLERDDDATSSRATISFSISPFFSNQMVTKFEKSRVTEIKVRMDCNGCVQKIKKAIHGIHGINEVYPDIAQQKLTVIGWADPESIVMAIRKTRKIATICSHSEPTEPPPQGGSSPPEAANPPPSEAPTAEAAAQPQPASTPVEPPKDQPSPANQQPEPAAATDANAGQKPPQPSAPKDAGELAHVIGDDPSDYGHRYGYVHSYGGPWSRQYPNSQGNFCPEPLNRHPTSQIFHHEPPQPAFVTHSYNTYKPSTHVTEYEYVHSPPRHTHCSRIEHYNEDYNNYYSSGSSSSSSNGNGNITSIFSDDNPNACRIM